jgi:hypothetical protein
MIASIHFTAHDLKECFRCDEQTAKVAQQLLHSCCNQLERGDYAGHHSHAVGGVLEKLNRMLGTYGVQGFLFEDGSGDGCLYLCKGDTYRRTLLWLDETQGFELNAWGDLVEARDSREDDCDATPPAYRGDCWAKV